MQDKQEVLGGGIDLTDESPVINFEAVNITTKQPVAQTSSV